MSPEVNSHKHEEQEDLDETKSFWGIRCEGGKGYSRVLSKRCTMTMAALEPNTSRAENPWVSLMMERDDSEFLLCSLKHDAIMQVNLNLIFEKGEKIKFYVRGQGTVHLSGYQEGSCVDTEVDVTDRRGNVEDLSTLGKVVKNGQIFCEICDLVIKSELKWREHILKKKHNKNLKRKFGNADRSPSSSKNFKNMPSTSKAASVDEEVSSSEIEEIPSNMPSGSGGSAGSSRDKVKHLLSENLINTLNNIDDEDDDDEEEDKDFNVLDEEEEEESDEDSEYDEESDEDDDSDNSNDLVHRTLEAQKRKREEEAAESRKRMKKRSSISEASTSAGPEVPTEVFEVDDDQNSSSSDDESDDSNEDSGTRCKMSPMIKNSQVSKEKKKLNHSVRQNNSESKSVKNDTFLVQDLRPGYGPPARPGKIVQIFYTGKLPDGTVFDETEVGEPFSFELGAGQVIPGWEKGIVGMKVGGRRKLTIPPHMGYGRKAMDDVPANSTLIYIVDLISIS